MVMTMTLPLHWGWTWLCEVYKYDTYDTHRGGFLVLRSVLALHGHDYDAPAALGLDLTL